jgi:hypothetical protein
MKSARTAAERKTLPIPAGERPGIEFLRDGFTAAYLFDRTENRLFLLEDGNRMSVVDSPGMREVILAIGERITLGEALLILESQRETATATA